MTFEMPSESNPVVVVEGDNLEILPQLPADSFDCILTDPPYGLEFMGKEWDSFRGESRMTKTDRMREFQSWCHGWASQAIRVLKPGGYAAIFGGTRTYHRLTCAVEDAGFEVRDCIMWVYGSGFPKAQSCLKPAYEPILLARKTGSSMLPLGIDGCRVPASDNTTKDGRYAGDRMRENYRTGTSGKPIPTDVGRWPANLVHDGSSDVLAGFPETSSGVMKAGQQRNKSLGKGGYHDNFPDIATAADTYGDSGSAARFFYCAKASKSDRGEGNTHPTVKPQDLMRWLVRLVCPVGGKVLDPFGGSGSTALAAESEGRACVLIEKSAEYAAICRKRIAAALADGPGTLIGSAKLNRADLFAEAGA